MNRVCGTEGIELIVVLLPYEMQISREAAETYAELGIHWEPGFIGGATQRMLSDRMNPEIPIFDSLLAFVGQDDPEPARQKHRVGEFFVYNKGDKLDWNHPNRAGHRRIANFLIEAQILGEPTDLSLTRSATRVCR